MSDKVISFYKYKMEHTPCSPETQKKMFQIMETAVPRAIRIGEDLRVHEYRPDGHVYEWTVEGSLENVAAYATSNDFGKIFYDIETDQPLFCFVGKELVLWCSDFYADELRYVLDSFKEYSLYGQEFLYK